jgi:serine/threonine protein kinase
MRLFCRSILPALLSIPAIAAVAGATDLDRSGDPPPALYSGAWEYRYGDSPRDAHGDLAWAAPSPPPEGFQPAPLFISPPGRADRSTLWVRTRLEGAAFRDPTLYLLTVDQIFEAYLDGERVYAFGQIDGSGPNARRFLGYRPHYIPLGQHYQGKTLALRIYSEHINIGIIGQPRIGSRAALVALTVREDLGELGIGLLLAAAGAAVLVLFALRRERAYFFYGGFALFVGLYVIAQTQTRALLIDAPLGWLHAELLFLYLIPAFLLPYLEVILGRGPLGLMGRLSQAFGAYVLLAVALVAAGLVPVLSTLLPFQILLMLGVIYTLTTAVIGAVRGSSEARIFTAGFSVTALLAMYDILAAMGLLERTTLTLTHYGNGVFVLTLGFIVARRFARVTARAMHIEVEASLRERRIGEQRALLDAAARISEGDLDTPIVVPEGSELRHLARALDATRVDLLAKIRLLEAGNAEIQSLNEELRRQIEQRSRRLLEMLLRDERLKAGEATRPLGPGDLVGEHYQVVKKLGEGATGVVYEVERLTDGRRLAAKVLTSKADKTSLVRFGREAQILARLSHPNLIGIVDVDVTEEGALYIVMELVAGATLHRLGWRFGDLAWARSILRQIAEALAVVHERGIVHRDLKPANVLVAHGPKDAAPLIKLADFGISILIEGDAPPLLPRRSDAPPLALDVASEIAWADAETITLPKVRVAPAPQGQEARGPMSGRISSIPPRPFAGAGTVTETGIIVGTPVYMAPELAQGSKQARPAADIFSFGVIAYELITKEMPFDVPPLLAGMRGEPLKTPEGLRDREGIDPRLADLVLRCLSEDPSARPTALEVAARLGDLGAPPRPTEPPA